MTWNDVAQAKYALLTTYKKDGTAVGTPVWIAPDGHRLVVWTHPGTGKVKRIRRNPAVTLQVCDPRGQVRDDDIVTGTAQVADAEGTERVRAAVARKYRVLGRLTVEAHKLFRGADRSVGVVITPIAVGE
ncbi:PPOX class F420-dependent oxidoreductase [Nocardia huaxiensis]|uniref:PPOX class F420-dependent oxidoreductase n=1 Tax=Nocardia huaxiensis TaxID=2755382 RepID=A0A7D6V7B5_9NOCA|nr:PPOX class F420-dependent oxidoreductase [Nocardia huaxiensis]QLY27913.1 PPOX class F420-dependent oxidoreductase [Nocardia huaxiensis]UFS98682.1 PPOX class F420-dependent oxidoreductase [Nocardia huaxiensis]